jgi:2-dehydro-3-deoxyphosphogluconate aldolase/(4S)-4-hydroxy-2-oxoglutarate aldolase
VEQHRAIAVIRTTDPDLGWSMAQAVMAGGMQLIEIAWTDGAAPLITRLRRAHPDHWIGTGTITNSEQLAGAIAAGAQFCFSPATQPPLIAQALAQDLPFIPGALSPTEIVTAWQAGAPCVKVFPIACLGGARYIQALQGPLGQIPLIPTGGVALEQAKTLVAAGAIGVGLSTGLFTPEAMATRDWPAITANATQVMEQFSDR